MKLIPLTGNKGKDKFAKVDDEDYECLIQWKWHIHQGYARRIDNKRYKKYTLPMHREIMNCIKGDGKCIDHKDMDRLNNQKNNLRFCNHSQNGSNKRSKLNSSSKYLGVTRRVNNKNPDNRSCDRYAVSIRVNRKAIYLGSFILEKDAAIAYNQAAQKYFGEFANLNIVD